MKIQNRSPLSNAVALRYDGTRAPQVTAKGQGEIAEQILRVAKEHNIPLHTDPELADLLSRLELGDEIPRALYLAVAEVIAFAYRVSERAGGRSREMGELKREPTAGGM